MGYGSEEVAASEATPAINSVNVCLRSILINIREESDVVVQKQIKKLLVRRQLQAKNTEQTAVIEEEKALGVLYTRLKRMGIKSLIRTLDADFAVIRSHGEKKKPDPRPCCHCLLLLHQRNGQGDAALWK